MASTKNQIKPVHFDLYPSENEPTKSKYNPVHSTVTNKTIRYIVFRTVIIDFDSFSSINCYVYGLHNKLSAAN